MTTKKSGVYIENGVQFLYDGYAKNGRSSPIKYCPLCDTESRIGPSQVNNIKKGRSNGLCRDCTNSAISKANSGRKKDIPDEYLPCGSIVHWSSRKNKTVKTTCGMCNKTRKNYISNRYSKRTKSGLCNSCAMSLRIERNHSMWKGGKQTDDDGYILLHPSNFSEEEKTLFGLMVRQSGYILEHRAVVALHLKRPLNKDEIVHHKNGVKDDNRLENLMLTTPQDHANDEIRTLKAEIERLRGLIKT